MVIAILAVPAAVLASPPPMPPSLVCGDVTIDGSPAPIGAEILAEINNTEVSTVVKKEGKYCIGIPDGEDNEGKMITFKINGITNSTRLECVNINTTSRISFNLAITTESAP